MRKTLIAFILTTPFILFGQTYDDYIGAGHSEGITVTSSSNFQAARAENTLNGSGMDVPLFKTSRFLAQATLGADIELIEEVHEMGIEPWLEEQFTLQPTYLTPTMKSIWDERLQMRIDAGENPDEVFGPWALDFNYSWWQVNMTAQDLLRQRVAFALSEILVVSINSDLRDRAASLTDYYDLFLEHAFGNYRDLLYDVTLHPSMGYYLSHLNNPRANEELNQRPDENYAREIMQLFSIGLYELNNDGTRKLNGGNPIPTYDNDDIKEFAKVFTGLGPGGINMYVDWTDEPYFGLGFWGLDPEVPMKMYEEFHESGSKELLNGYTIPDGQTGMQDIEDAVDHLFNHPNVGPFVAIRLIQRLVKSNPSPAYVNRVANAFNGNGGSSRGNMENVIRAILMDPEARDDEFVRFEESAMLREPMVRYINFARAIPKDVPLGRYWHNGYDMANDLKQHTLASPTVFNFFTPDYQPVGEIAAAGQVAPEFKLHNTSTSINYLNKVLSWTQWWALMYSWEGDYGDLPIFIDVSSLSDMADDPDVLTNYLDIIFTHGQMTDELRDNMRTTLTEIQWGDDPMGDRVKMALYLMLISPDFNLIK